MLKNILNLEGVSVLSKKQQGSINGGGTCQALWHWTQLDAEGNVHYMTSLSTGITANQAENLANNTGGNWCCDSCSTASWSWKGLSQ